MNEKVVELNKNVKHVPKSALIIPTFQERGGK